jgi:hypothetical protein
VSVTYPLKVHKKKLRPCKANKLKLIFAHKTSYRVKKVDNGTWSVDTISVQLMYLVWVSIFMHNPQRCCTATLDVDGQMSDWVAQVW